MCLRKLFNVFVSHCDKKGKSYFLRDKILVKLKNEKWEKMIQLDGVWNIEHNVEYKIVIQNKKGISIKD